MTIPPPEERAPGPILPLHNGVQHYPWGDPDFIPRLLGIPNPERRPYAELWMGAHPDLPSEVERDGRRIGLDALIADAPEAVLGDAAATFEGRLPYLFKVLAAAAPLSIQAHPSRAQAVAGFAREEAAGVARTAPDRSYRDDNHKPELLAALTDFWGLRGFRPLDEIARVLEAFPGLGAVAPDFTPTPDGLRSLYGRLMTMPQSDVDAILAPAVARLADAQAQRPFTRDDREHWILRANELYARDGHHDRGLFSIWLLNLVRLAPGEAMHQPAGVLHAYLEGAGMELMANSNNVLRGGLTGKHVDVPELLDTVVFEGGPPEIVRPQPIAAPAGGAPAWRYPTNEREFELHRLELAPGRPCHVDRTSTPAITAVVAVEDEGVVTATDSRTALTLARGQTFLAPAGARYSITAETPATLYRATVPG